MVHLTIDGQEVTVPADSTVLEASQQLGITIPTLCHHPDLTPTGACRLCVVEIEGMRTLETSCTLPVTEGMVVRTQTDKVRDSRRFALSMLLTDHPNECMTCEVDGDCELQRWVYEYDVKWPEHSGARHSRPIDSDPNPVIMVDMNKCILCGRCVRACAEIQGRNVWNFSERGFDTLVVAGANQPMLDTDCESCGNCVAYCPVGALFDKPSQGWGRAAYQTKVRTTCTYCGVGCQFDLNVKDGKITRVTSTPEAPANGMALCVKGRYGWDFVHSDERLTVPLIRDANGGSKYPGFREASWDEALDLIAQKLTYHRDHNGPDSVGYLSSAKCTNEENYLMQKLARAVGKTNNVDHCARLCHSSTVAGLASTLGSGAMTNSIEDSTGDAKLYFITGSNTTEQHPVIGIKMRRAIREKGTKLIVADPRKIDLCDLAVLHLQQRPGTDVALFNGIMREIIVNGWEDKEYIAERTENFAACKEVVMKYTLELTEEITTVPAAKIKEAARLLHENKPGAVFWSMGITQHTTGTMNVMSLANLQMLLGNLGVRGGGVNPLRGQNNVQGACDLGTLSNVYPGYQKVVDPAMKEKFEAFWGVEGLSDKVGLTVVELMNAAHDGDLKALYVFAENPMTSDPDLNHVKVALETLDFLVVQDIFMTETAKYATVILPSTCFAEKEGTFTSTERRIQRVRKAVQAPGKSRPDWQIICEVGTRMGYPMYYDSPADVMDEIAACTPIYSGVHYWRLDAGAQLAWPVRGDDHPGTPILHVGKFARGLGLFTANEHLEPHEAPDDEYPFTMTTGRVLYHWHGGEQTRRSESLLALYPEPLVEINPDDANRLGIVDGDQIKLASRRGELVARAWLTDRVAPGLVFSTFHFPAGNANWLTGAFLDPVAKIPEYKVSAVKVEKIA
ncbi:MAG: formate dehydrogenase subunit alpha [Anaerolineae bacterium]|nr:formate dehydrogenase subunit alpha [Anaerolineae bacterium]